jgi:hypothetical protein
MDKILNKLLIVSSLTLVVVVAIGLLTVGSKGMVGSVNQGNAYKSITTTATTSVAYMVKKGAGNLGSIIITTLGAGNIVFYDATTTVPTQRTTQATSSLRVVATVGTSQAAGTYTYDNEFYSGLMAVYSGVQGTSTVTFR